MYYNLFFVEASFSLAIKTLHSLCKEYGIDGRIHPAPGSGYLVG